MLRAHTARCLPCAAFQAETAALTSCLRLAPLEPMPAPVVLPTRRRSASRLAQVGAAAAVAVLAAGIGAMLSSTDTAVRAAEPVRQPTEAQLMVAYLDAPRGLPQRAPIAFRPRIGLDPGPSNV
jgi:hypothetical protein